MTVCNCYHLTSFALVMSPSSSPPENRPLSIATKAGLSLSILCLLATILLLSRLKLKNKSLHRVHRQLALALGLAQLVFLVGVDRSAVPSPDQLCSGWAALLHYLLLATFLWQLCEGLHLYLLIGKVFGTFDKAQVVYCLIAWGLPLLIVGPTLGLRFCDYGSRNYCWITPDGGALWAFHGPVIAVLLINVVVLVYVVTVIVRLTRRKEGDACLLITLIHASVVLVPILGVTWGLGFLVVAGGVYATVVEWLFFVFTTLQGVAIFLTHCVLNREVRSTFLRAVGCRKIADNQDTLVNAGRKMSRTTVSQSYMLRRNSSLLSGSLAVGGFKTPTATPSRRESETENPYHFSLVPITEESSRHGNTTPIAEESSH
jgi:G protein-coupled receptor 133